MINYYKKAISNFDRQIKNEIKVFKHEKNCPSYLDKKLFEISVGLTIDEWKEVRSGEYYKIRDTLKEQERKKLLIKRIENLKRS